MVAPKGKDLGRGGPEATSSGAMEVTQVVGGMPPAVLPLGAATTELDPSATPITAAATTANMMGPFDPAVKLPAMMAPGTNTTGPDMRKPRGAVELKMARESR